MPDQEEWVEILLDAIVSNVLASGYFDRVNLHEPKSPPASGLTVAIWWRRIIPIQVSGLNATSALVTFTIRIYANMLQEPQDLIDPSMTKAVSGLLRRYHDDFDFDATGSGGLDLGNGITVRNIDLLGSSGEQFRADSGYLEVDRTMYRVADIQLPIIVNDVWPQAGG
jgi:hypothetical protein